MSRNAQPDPSSAQPGEEPTDKRDTDHTPTDPAALRAQVALLERDLEARESQVNALREQYETALAARDADEDRELRTDGGRTLVGRLWHALSL
ncbi:hypothetical protein [Haloarchaeobius sp. FL176]|uniref:hypothetical protein n=1 Tax=Haloarchaeobius sp. FL176 TaxID=2967129 RepID=UPI0021498E7A|nr:hypothetical protein [Haloarchaeobius sp. FL176]